MLLHSFMTFRVTWILWSKMWCQHLPAAWVSALVAKFLPHVWKPNKIWLYILRWYYHGIIFPWLIYTVHRGNVTLKHITASVWWTVKSHSTSFQTMLFMGTRFLKNLGDMAAEQTLRLLSLISLDNLQSSADILRPFFVICGVCSRVQKRADSRRW